MKETRGIPKREEAQKGPRIIAGQKTYLLSKSPLRCYYYAKQAKGKWSTADRAVQGMRWNAYMISGRSTPFFSPMEPERLPPAAAQNMKEIQAERERIRTTKDRKVRNHSPAGPVVERRNRESHAHAAVPNAEIGTGASAGTSAEASIIPVSIHPKFRHLRLISGKNQDHAPVIPIRREVRKPAEGSSASSPAQSPSAERAINTAQSFSIQPCEAAAGFEEREFHPPEMPATARIALPERREEVKSSEAGAPEAQRPDHSQKMVRITRIDLRVSENDNARPWGFDDDRGVPSNGALAVSVSASMDGLIRPLRVGYISSARKKAAQLKLASGAASVPQ